MAYTATVLAWGGLEFDNGYTVPQQKAALARNLKVVTDYFLAAWSPSNQTLAAQVYCLTLTCMCRENIHINKCAYNNLLMEDGLGSFSKRISLCTLFAECLTG